MKKSTLGTLSLIAAMGMMGGMDSMLGPMRTKKSKEKMPLTPEEEIALATLSGKEKKQYVRMLKEKYKK